MLLDKGKLKDLKNYVGTSSGSIIGSLMSVGYTPLDLLCYVCSNNIYSKIKGLDVSNLLTSNSGMMSFEPISKEIIKLFVDKIGFVPTLKQIETLYGKTVVLVAFNISQQKREYIRASTHPDVLITDAIRMSSNFPFIFNHFCYEGNYYVDGGFADNFAVEYAESLGEKCVGIVTINETSPFTALDSHLEYIRKLFFSFIQLNVKDKIQRTKKNTDVVAIKRPPNFFNFTTSPFTLIDMFDAGYDFSLNNS